MISVDIVYVTYFSEKWLDGYFKSLLSADYDLKRVNLYFVDNGSEDGTIKKLEEVKKEFGARFGEFIIHQSKENVGFGAGNNIGVSLGHSPYVFCSNIDTELYEDTLAQISKAVEADQDSEFALWELRQFPYEHPKFYDPITLETSWSSGAAFVIRRDVYEQIGGFDEQFFMYAEDVDLSWRVRAAGYKLKYVPKAVIQHFCYQTAGEVKPTQYIYSPIGNLQLRYKFGTRADRVWGWQFVWINFLRRRAPFPRGRRMFLKALMQSIKKRRAALKWRKEHQSEIERHKFTFYAMDYELRRRGDFWVNERPRQEKKVSVIVRTCGRPDVLRETLISLRNQTYPNLEIVVVEDGQAAAKGMIETEFADLPIIYQATGIKGGRCKAGNLALSLATGDYLNFLDDDDVFYADHIETLVMAMQNHPDSAAAYALGFETPIEIQSLKPYRYQTKSYDITVDVPFDKIELMHHNCFPIQTVLFSRKLYEKHGGFDEELDMLEDWDFWIRYASEDWFEYVPKTTSQYRVPANRAVVQERQRKLDEAYKTVQDKHRQDKFILTGDELIGEYQQSLKKIMLASRSRCGGKGFFNLLFRAVRKLYHICQSAKAFILKMIGKL